MPHRRPKKFNAARSPVRIARALPPRCRRTPPFGTKPPSCPGGALGMPDPREEKPLPAIGKPAQISSSRATMRAIPVALGGMVARTVASPAPTSSWSAVCTSRCTYSESQFMRLPRETLARFSGAIQLRKAFRRFAELNSLFSQSGLEPLNNFLRGSVAERVIRELALLGSDVLRQPVVLLFQAGAFGGDVDGLGVDNSHVEQGSRAHRASDLRQFVSRDFKLSDERET